MELDSDDVEEFRYLLCDLIDMIKYYDSVLKLGDQHTAQVSNLIDRAEEVRDRMW